MSLIEDVFAIGSTVMMVVIPVAMLVLVVVGVTLGVWLMRRMWRFVRDRRAVRAAA